MKTAICLSGELRSIRKTFPRIKRDILDQLESYDVFYHTWVDDPDIRDLNVLIQDGNLRDILIEPRITFDEKNYNLRKRSEVFIQGFLRQLYCLKKCNMLKKQYEAEHDFIYDAVIRVRPDIYPILDSKLEKIDVGKIQDAVYVPTHDHWHGYNDRLYYSSSPNMDIISSRFDKVDDYFNKGGIIHYETFLKYIVDTNSLKVLDSDLKFVLLRNNGEKNGELVEPEVKKTFLDKFVK